MPITDSVFLPVFKPVINPSIGISNLLKYSQQFDNEVWDKGIGGSVSANSVIAPDGSLTADAYTWAISTGSYALLAQYFGGQNPVGTFTFSIWMKRPSGSGSKILRLNITDVFISTGISGQTTVTETWQRFSYTRASATNTGSIGVGLSQGGGGTILPGDIIHVWGAQLELNTVATNYQPTSSS